MTNVQIFILGVLAGVVGSVIIYFWSKRPKEVKLIKDDVIINPNNMVEVSDFDEEEYTKDQFNIAMYSIQTDDNWKLYVDSNEIRFTRNNDSNLSVSAEFRYDFDKDSGKKFKISSSRVITSKGGYSSDNYYIRGEVDHNVKALLYKKYIDWKNKINEDKKMVVDKKLETFNSVLGKSAGRDRKLDELLNN
jgi:hypothetical protein